MLFPDYQTCPCTKRLWRDCHNKVKKSSFRKVFSSSLKMGVRIGLNHRVSTYKEGKRITTSAPMESADQAARAGGRVSTTMLY